jgi:DNA-binding HxlR family transcriptional regulator
MRPDNIDLNGQHGAGLRYILTPYLHVKLIGANIALKGMGDRNRSPEEDGTEALVETTEEKYLGVTEKQELFTLLGRAHTMEIIHIFVQEPGPWRFNELREVLEVSQNTLSARLSELLEAELLTRQSYDEIPPRVEYRATEKLTDLRPMFQHLSEWAEQYDH